MEQRNLATLAMKPTGGKKPGWGCWDAVRAAGMTFQQLAVEHLRGWTESDIVQIKKLVFLTFTISVHFLSPIKTIHILLLASTADGIPVLPQCDYNGCRIMSLFGNNFLPDLFRKSGVIVPQY